MSTCLGIWLLGTFSFAYIVSDYLERHHQAQLELASDLARQAFETQIQNLRSTAELISKEAALKPELSKIDAQSWQQRVLPLRPILQADIIQIFNAEGDLLLSIRQPVLTDNSLRLADVKAKPITNQTTSALINSDDARFSTLIAASPIGNSNAPVGSVIIGQVVNDNTLQRIAEQTESELVAFDNQFQIASTFTDRGERFSETQFSEETAEVIVNGVPYLTKSVVVSGLNGTVLTIATFQSLAPLKRLQRTLWLSVLLVAGVGAGVTVAVGNIVARKITGPIASVTHTAQQVIQTTDFGLQANVKTQDEVGVLAMALNQLIQWTGSYTRALEQSQAKLKHEIQERSQALEFLKAAQSQLIQAEKMSGLGQMVAGIAHEINNPINFIYGNLQHAQLYTQDLLQLIALYKEKYSADDPEIQVAERKMDLDFVQEDFPKILKSMMVGTERTKEIIVSLRNFARLDEAERKSVDISDGINSTLLILRHRTKYGIEIIKNYEHSSLTNCYPAQLNQVFMNIISNALDVLEDSDLGIQPTITIHTATMPGKETLISIKDNGPGVPKKLKERIFDPFFTTKPVGKGTGIGLSICYQIIEKHKGKLLVQSAKPQGAEFVILLPNL